MAPLMFSLRFMFFLSPVLFLMISTQSQWCSNDKGNYTTNSTYQTNLNTLLSSFYSPSNNGNGYGFYNPSYGEIGLCRGDVTVDNCRYCLSNATQVLTQSCPNQKEAFFGLDQCILRYTNRSIYGAMETRPAIMLYNVQNVSSSDVGWFYYVLMPLLKDISGQAARNGSLRKFAAGTAAAAGFQPIYGLAQCMPDLTEMLCSDCLDTSLEDIVRYFPAAQQGGRIIKPSCDLRYEIYPFVDPTTVRPLPSPPPPLSNPPPPSTSTGGSKSNRSQTVIIIVVPCCFCGTNSDILLHLFKSKEDKEKT
ncbi:hypothetical protein ACE6H2_020752 [Prunus campanulata]